MTLNFIDRRAVADIKQKLAVALDVKSAHLTEAIAASLGYGSNAALQVAFETPGFKIKPDLDAFMAKLALLNYDIDVEDVKMPWVNATYRSDNTHFDSEGSFVRQGCITMRRALNEIARDTAHGAIIASIFPLFPDRNADRIEVENGRLCFNPLKLGKVEDARRDISRAIHPHSFGRIPVPRLITKRRLENLSPMKLIDKLSAEFDATPPMLTETASVILAVHLTTRLDDINSDFEWDIAAAKLKSMAARHLTDMAVVALQAEISRSSMMSSRSLTDEDEAQNIIGCTNTKFFMKIDDPVATMDLAIKIAAKGHLSQAHMVEIDRIATRDVTSVVPASESNSVDSTGSSGRTWISRVKPFLPAWLQRNQTDSSATKN